MGTGLKATCTCGYEAEASIGSSRAGHGKIFRFPHFCNDCQTAGSVDTLSERPACNNCGSTNVTSYETNTKLVPNRLLERLGRDFLRKRGYHLQQEELDPSYCYVLEKTFIMLRWHNHCPKCQTNNLTFYPYIYFD
jgi:Zn finger protein HypA/HybF involved in hydrogenase expression